MAGRHFMLWLLGWVMVADWLCTMLFDQWVLVGLEFQMQTMTPLCEEKPGKDPLPKLNGGKVQS